ncbi:MAG: acyl-CoA thioesterase II [Bacteroidetes bacterium]|nr:MAG: acyl-CoA thioesterase II [Bacteroidota bacterium]
MKTVKELIELLTLEQIGEGRYQGMNYQTPWRRVFGGQALGQALHAAYQTVPADRFAHSLHGYFILTGDIDLPVIYDVDIIRDGGSFTTRRVVARQNDQVIFILAASFQVRQDGFDHQITMPNVLPPEVLLPDYEQAKSLEADHPDLYRRLTIIHPNALEFRPVEKFDPANPNVTQPYRHVWIKAKEEVTLDLPMQQQILAYASDYNLLGTAVLPHLQTADYSTLFLASLDHAMWFHRDFRIDDWLLYALDSPSASNSRGFTRGNIFNQEGKLVASVVQEGLIREVRKKG